MTLAEKQHLFHVYAGILHNNQRFQAGEARQVAYRFDCPEYAQLAQQYDLAARAGQGTDTQRAIRLLRWLAPRLTHCSWFDNRIPCNALSLLEYSLDNPAQGINCVNKAKILAECCLALGIYARRVRLSPYSPYDFDCHVVTEIYDRAEGRWLMLDPTTNGFLVDETRRILSVLEARQRLASGQFVTFLKAGARPASLAAARDKNLETTSYYAKNLFLIQVEDISRFGEGEGWLHLIPEHFSVRENSLENARYRAACLDEGAALGSGFDRARAEETARRMLQRAQQMREPAAVEAEPLQII